jgi:hypothetical protein
MAKVIEMPPNVWGPIFWNTIHIITIAYPVNPDDETQQAAKNFFYSLQYLLPCPICKEHYKKHLQETPPNVSSQKEIINYAFNLHNKVNKDLGKREISYQEFMNHIKSLSEPSNQTYNLLLILALTSTIAISYYLYKKLK